MKKTIADFLACKKNNGKIAMLTAYDFPGAEIADACGVDVILVGDSVGTNVLGYDSPTQVTMADMLHHVKAVTRAAKNTFVCADLPYKSIDTKELAVASSTAFVAAGADAVKMEGGEEIIPVLQAVLEKNIPVCAHIGFTPQSCGAPHVVGKTLDEAKRLIRDAQALADAGAFMIVLELMPEELAAEITKRVSIPAIGIGAGRFCDGQVQVFHDMTGLSAQVFRHVKAYAHTRDEFTKAIKAYVDDVESGQFPQINNASHLPKEVLEEFKEWEKTI